ncbi:uncharacterized protein G2W53_027531 [Senna tora]|uniref:Uncharacterized protein n=1 Tax=Senna tora TaxID=362788 RepID=A0A834TJ61_9FABA|nr:uncharacterized protein G2W53_027531 [Senna tora]
MGWTDAESLRESSLGSGYLLLVELIVEYENIAYVEWLKEADQFLRRFEKDVSQGAEKGCSGSSEVVLLRSELQKVNKDLATRRDENTECGRPRPKRTWSTHVMGGGIMPLFVEYEPTGARQWRPEDATCPWYLCGVAFLEARVPRYSGDNIWYYSVAYVEWLKDADQFLRRFEKDVSQGAEKVAYVEWLKEADQFRRRFEKDVSQGPEKGVPRVMICVALSIAYVEWLKEADQFLRRFEKDVSQGPEKGVPRVMI